MPGVFIGRIPRGFSGAIIYNKWLAIISPLNTSRVLLHDSIGNKFIVANDMSEEVIETIALTYKLPSQDALLFSEYVNTRSLSGCGNYISCIRSAVSPYGYFSRVAEGGSFGPIALYSYTNTGVSPLPDLQAFVFKYNNCYILISAQGKILPICMGSIVGCTNAPDRSGTWSFTKLVPSDCRYIVHHETHQTGLPKARTPLALAEDQTFLFVTKQIARRVRNYTFAINLVGKSTSTTLGFELKNGKKIENPTLEDDNIAEYVGELSNTAPIIDVKKAALIIVSETAPLPNDSDKMSVYYSREHYYMVNQATSTIFACAPYYTLPFTPVNGHCQMGWAGKVDGFGSIILTSDGLQEVIDITNLVNAKVLFNQVYYYTSNLSTPKFTNCFEIYKCGSSTFPIGATLIADENKRTHVITNIGKEIPFTSSTVRLLQPNESYGSYMAAKHVLICRPFPGNQFITIDSSLYTTLETITGIEAPAKSARVRKAGDLS